MVCTHSYLKERERAWVFRTWDFPVNTRQNQLWLKPQIRLGFKYQNQVGIEYSIGGRETRVDNSLTMYTGQGVDDDLRVNSSC